MKTIVTFAFLLFGGYVFSQGQSLGEVIGTIIDESDKLGIPGALVWIEDDEKKYQAITDENGKFRISAIPAGKYYAKVTDYIDTIDIPMVNVPMDGFGNVGIFTFSKSKELVEATIVHNKTFEDLKLELNSSPVYKLTSEEIVKMPVKFDVKAMVAVMSSDVKLTDDGELVFRGSRKGEMIYYLDGVKLSNTENTPSCSINNMMVYTGGIPAKYGDTLGGVVVVETKSYFDLLREYKMSHRE